MAIALSGYPALCGEPVSYAIDLVKVLSATPSTPLGAVDGVGDRIANQSMA
jgi:hypothetical protein